MKTTKILSYFFYTLSVITLLIVSYMGYNGARLQENMGAMFGLILSYTASGLTFLMLIKGSTLKRNVLIFMLCGLVFAEAGGIFLLSNSAGISNTIANLKDIFSREQLDGNTYLNSVKGQLDAATKANNEFLQTCKNVAYNESLPKNGGAQDVANFATGLAADTSEIAQVAFPTLAYKEGMTIPTANKLVKRYWEVVDSVAKEMRARRTTILGGAKQKVTIINNFKTGKSGGQIGSLTSIETKLSTLVALGENVELENAKAKVVEEIDLTRLESVSGGSITGRLVGLANLILLILCAFCEYQVSFEDHEEEIKRGQNFQNKLKGLSKDALDDFDINFLIFLLNQNFKNLTKDEVQLLFNAGTEKILELKKEFPLQEDVLFILKSNLSLSDLSAAGKAQQVLNFLRKGFEVSDLEGIDQPTRDLVEKRFNTKMANKYFYLVSSDMWNLLKDGLELKESEVRFFGKRDVRTFGSFFASPIYDNHRMARFIADLSSQNVKAGNWFRKLADLINEYEEFVKKQIDILQTDNELVVERKEVEELATFTINDNKVTFSYPSI